MPMTTRFGSGSSMPTLPHMLATVEQRGSLTISNLGKQLR